MATPATKVATRPDGNKLRQRILHESFACTPFRTTSRCSGVVNIGNSSGWALFAESEFTMLSTRTWHRRLIMSQKARKNHAAPVGEAGCSALTPELAHRHHALSPSGTEK